MTQQQQQPQPSPQAIAYAQQVGAVFNSFHNFVASLEPKSPDVQMPHLLQQAHDFLDVASTFAIKYALRNGPPPPALAVAPKQSAANDGPAAPGETADVPQTD